MLTDSCTVIFHGWRCSDENEVSHVELNDDGVVAIRFGGLCTFLSADQAKRLCEQITEAQMEVTA